MADYHFFVYISHFCVKLVANYESRFYRAKSMAEQYYMWNSQADSLILSLPPSSWFVGPHPEEGTLEPSSFLFALVLHVIMPDGESDDGIAGRFIELPLGMAEGCLDRTSCTEYMITVNQSTTHHDESRHGPGPMISRVILKRLES